MERKTGLFAEGTIQLLHVYSETFCGAILELVLRRSEAPGLVQLLEFTNVCQFAHFRRRITIYEFDSFSMHSELDMKCNGEVLDKQF